MGRDKIQQASYPILTQLYSLTERFLYDYIYEFKLTIVCTFHQIVAKASQDLSAYSVFEHEVFQLSFNLLHPKPKDVQNNNYRVHDAKLIHTLIYYAFFRGRINFTEKSFIHINDQLTSPYFLNYNYKIKQDYLTRTLRNFDPTKKTIMFFNRESHPNDQS